MKASNILATIGNTPHVRLNKLFGSNHEVWIKLEKTNPGSSIKDRIALAMIEDAEEKGILNNFPEDKRSSESAWLFLQLIMRKLKKKSIN